MGDSKAKKRKGAGRKTTVDDLPEHVIEDILFRLGPYSPYLVRAALAYRPWFRVVADAGFLARLATTPHVGDYRTVDERTLFVPSSPLLDVDHFSLDFLPDSESWELADSRGSLLLLSKKESYCRYDDDDDRCSCYDLIVCDPLMKHYQEIACSLDDLHRSELIGLFLAHGDDGVGSRVSISNFKIIAVIEQTVVCSLIRGSDGTWRDIHDEFPDDPETVTAVFFAGRANGSLYWGLEEDCTMVIVLDEATAVLSLARLPVTVWGLSDDKTAGRIIDGEDGVLRVVRLVGKHLKVFARKRLGCSDKWVLEKKLCLSEATVGLPGHRGDESLFKQKFSIIGATPKYVLLSLSGDETWVFTVELDTMRVERQHWRNTYTGNVYPLESPWPPVLSELSKEQYVVMRRHGCVRKQLNNML